MYYKILVSDVASILLQSILWQSFGQTKKASKQQVFAGMGGAQTHEVKSWERSTFKADCERKCSTESNMLRC